MPPPAGFLAGLVAFFFAGAGVESPNGSAMPPAGFFSAFTRFAGACLTAFFSAHLRVGREASAVS